MALCSVAQKRSGKEHCYRFQIIWCNTNSLLRRYQIISMTRRKTMPRAVAKAVKTLSHCQAAPPAEPLFSLLPPKRGSNSHADTCPQGHADRNIVHGSAYCGSNAGADGNACTRVENRLVVPLLWISAHRGLLKTNIPKTNKICRGACISIDEPPASSSPNPRLIPPLAHNLSSRLKLNRSFPASSTIDRIHQCPQSRCWTRKGLSLRSITISPAQAHLCGF